MAIRVYFKDGTTVLLPQPVIISSYPDNDNFIAGKDSGGVVIALIPTANIAGAEIE